MSKDKLINEAPEGWIYSPRGSARPADQKLESPRFDEAASMLIILSRNKKLKQNYRFRSCEGKVQITEVVSGQCCFGKSEEDLFKHLEQILFPYKRNNTPFEYAHVAWGDDAKYLTKVMLIDPEQINIAKFHDGLRSYKDNSGCAIL